MLAQLGYEKLDDIIGKTNLLRPRDISLVKTQHLDLSYIISVCARINLLPCSFYTDRAIPFAKIDLMYASTFRMLACQNGAVRKSGIRMSIQMALFWMIF